MNKTSKLFSILQNNLLLEDPYCHFANNSNPFQFYFNDNDYIIHLTAIHGWEKRPEMRRIQIKPNMRDMIVKKSNYDFIFAILGYDFTSQSFASWSTEVVFTDFKSGKSLYINNESFLKVKTSGIAYCDNKSLDARSIVFKEISINEFLKNPQRSKISFNNNEVNFLNLNHKILSKSKFIKNEKKLEKQLFVKKISNKKISWDRVEYLVALNLYFKIKNNELKDNKKTIEIKAAYDLLLKRSNEENKLPRTLSSIYLRIQNFKATDPEWPGKGLVGGSGGRTKIIFDEFKNNIDALIKEVDEIYNKYGFTFSSNITSDFIEYTEETETDSQISIPLNLIDEYIEAQNLKDKSSNIHKLTLKKFVKLINQIDNKPLINKNTVDLFFRGNNNNYLVEIKSINKNNVRSQIRSAIIQLLEYEYFHKNIEKNLLFNDQRNIAKIIVLNENPLNFSNEEIVYLYNNLCLSQKIVLTFFNKSNLLKLDKNIKSIKMNFDE